MKQVNLNELKQVGMNLIIEGKTYNIEFIPYIIEKDIYDNMEKLNEAFQNIYSISEDWINKIKDWIWKLLTHKKNGNNIDLYPNLTSYNVLIGTNTPNLDYKLYVYGNSYVSGTLTVTKNAKINGVTVGTGGGDDFKNSAVGADALSSKIGRAHV